MMVYCVLCIEDSGAETTHIFSTAELAKQFVDSDQDRGHVMFDYLVDHPERNEGKWWQNA